MTIFMLKKYWGEITQYFRFECVHNWCTVCTFLIYFSRRGCFMYIYFNSYHNILSQNPKRFLEVIFEPLEKLRAFRNSQKSRKLTQPSFLNCTLHMHIFTSRFLTHTAMTTYCLGTVSMRISNLTERKYG